VRVAGPVHEGSRAFAECRSVDTKLDSDDAVEHSELLGFVHRLEL
jgi:hypothetical protein